MHPQTEAVMARYRGLGSTLEASRQVRVEFQEDRQHWHQLYERCWCGFLAVPVKYYTYDSRGIQSNTQAQAEKAYLAHLSPSDVPVKDVPTEMSPSIQVCADCRVHPPEAGRSVCSGCRKRAYRERSK